MMPSVSLRDGAGALMRAGVTRLLDLILPPSCLLCEGRVGEARTLCAPCWRQLHFLSAPQCACCGFPFAYDQGGGALCAACSARPPAFDRARAVLAYDDASRALLTRLKFGDRHDGVPAFGDWLVRAAQDMLDAGALIAPVPLHRRRLIARRFNQAALLAAALARRSGNTVIPDLLVRTRATPPQVGLTALGRKRNVARAFALRPRHGAAVRGSHIVLVDDVLTTGATVEACARVLKKAGAARVDVLTVARVVSERALPI